MRAILGLLMIMLGLAMAVVWMPESDGERQLASLTEISTQGLPRHTGTPPAAAPASQLRTFSPLAPLITSGQEPAARQQQPAQDPPTVTIYDQPPEPLRGVTAMSVVTGAVAASSAVGLDSSARAVGVLRPQPASAPTREDLVRGLQRELKRVGCYWGDVDGSWGAGSKRAMGQFVERINASLPVDQPDIVLLTLLQSHSGSACGKDCPQGQTMTDNSRCVPTTVAAQSNRTTIRRLPQRAARASQDAAPTSGTDRASPPAAANASVAEQWSTRVQREPTEAIAIAPLAASGAAVAVAAAPMPGRMSIGGPGAGAIVAPARPATPAAGAVQGAAEPERPAASSRKRTRRAGAPRRQMRQAPPPVAFRYYYAGQAQDWRAPRPNAAPRIAAPRYYASPPRRTASRSWTAKFFNQ